MEQEGALQSQARTEIELRGNCSIRRLEMGHWKQEIGLRLVKMGDLRWEMGKRGKRTLDLNDLGWVIDLSINIMSVS